ncbi:MAG: hypothetical protein IJU86_03865 [Firmicutes bacterium]|nr:hypothetical protein [Bacillota bacterium]
MRSKALTIGKVLVSVPAVIFRAAARFIGSLVADIVCLFMGPMRLYSNIKPAGKQQWIAFGFRVLGLSIYNSIALILNATLGLLYNLVESAFMMYELWTADGVTAKELYRSGDKNANEENTNENEENNKKEGKKEGKSAKLVVKCLVGIIDIDNPMSKWIAHLCTKISDNKIFKAVSTKVVELINKLFAVTKQSKEELNIYNNNNSNLGIDSEANNIAQPKENNKENTSSKNNDTINIDDISNLDKNNKDIKANKPYSLDSIFHPIHSFRAK